MSKYTLLITRTETAEMEVDADSQKEAREVCVARINGLVEKEQLNQLRWQRDGGIHVENLD